MVDENPIPRASNPEAWLTPLFSASNFTPTPFVDLDPFALLTSRDKANRRDVFFFVGQFQSLVSMFRILRAATHRHCGSDYG